MNQQFDNICCSRKKKATRTEICVWRVLTKLQLPVSALPGTRETLDVARRGCSLLPTTLSGGRILSYSILAQELCEKGVLEGVLCDRKEQEIPAGVEKMFRSLSKTLTFS